MKKEDCIFCMLANGDIPTRKIYEDDMFTVIMDNAPVTKGHALILPKNHYDNLYELPEDIAGKAFQLAKKLAGKMTERLHCEGFNVLQNNGEIAGQTIYHFHLHLIPRYADDNCDLRMEQTHPSEEEQDKILNLLKMDTL